MADLSDLQKVLGVTFKDPPLLEESLVHSSFINENPGFTSNERLEFLGDAVLGLVVAEKLFQEQEEAPEGEMTRCRAALVSRDTLFRVAKGINLGEYLYLGKGEEARGGRMSASNLASALEAVVAAVFLDQGLDAARGLILRLFDREIRTVTDAGRGADCKSQLQEYVQAKRQCTPTYRLVSAVGPDHDRVFTVEVLLGDTVFARGSGKNKKAAETEAAKKALEALLKEAGIQKT